MNQNQERKVEGNQDLKQYRVEVGYGEVGSAENVPLGVWEGCADSQDQAKSLAYDNVWDARLNAASCAPRYSVSEIGGQNRKVRIYQFGEAPEAAKLGYSIRQVVVGTEEEIKTQFSGDVIAVKGASIFGQEGANEWAIMTPTERNLCKGCQSGLEGRNSWEGLCYDCALDEGLVDSHVPGERKVSMTQALFDRLFIGVFCGGISYADRQREKHGDYARLAFLPYDTLELKVEEDCPPELRAIIVADAALIQAKRGERYTVTASGQTVMLGTSQRNQ